MRLRQPSVLPGFGLTLGVTLTWLSLIVLLPLAALALKTATLTWVAPAQTGTSAITGYVIRRYLGAGTAAQATTTVAATARTLTVTGLVNGTGYTFTVTATNASGAGRTSARTAVVTPKV